jgi:diguanylate cyclase (GGDEF)-like protein
MDTPKTLQQMVNECLNPGSGRRSQHRFPPELEKRFKDDQRDVKIRETILIGCIAALLYDLMLISDYTSGSFTFERGIFFRLFIFTPLFLMSIWIVHRWRVDPVREVVLVVAVSLAGACELMINFGYNGPVSAISQVGLLSIIYAGTVSLGTSLRYASAISAIMLCEDAVFFACDRWLTNGQKGTCASLIVACTLLLIISVYRTEILERKAYLFFLREELRVARLSDHNRELAEISNLDSLTGLSNRRDFDEYLQRSWEQAQQEATPISIILADIDHFKAINDNFGHLFGDHVLVAVSQILRSNFRHGEDLVARFGGEEFVVVLPRLDLDVAREAAERMCRQVRQMKLATPIGGSPLRVTISCGVSSGSVSSINAPSEMMVSADQALYRAKQSGRDQVCWTTHSSKHLPLASTCTESAAEFPEFNPAASRCLLP